MNLLQQTINFLHHNGQLPTNVLYVAARNQYMSWDEFAIQADTEYDNGYGSANVHESVLVVGTDWWLERHEYDGSEWWEFKTQPTKPKQHNPQVSIFHTP